MLKGAITPRVGIFDKPMSSSSQDIARTEPNLGIWEPAGLIALKKKQGAGEDPLGMPQIGWQVLSISSTRVEFEAVISVITPS
jgi:hypothetical protein